MVKGGRENGQLGEKNASFWAINSSGGVFRPAPAPPQAFSSGKKYPKRGGGK